MSRFTQYHRPGGAFVVLETREGNDGRTNALLKMLDEAASLTGDTYCVAFGYEQDPEGDGAIWDDQRLFADLSTALSLLNQSAFEQMQGAAFPFHVIERFREKDGSVTALLHCRPGSENADFCVAYGFDEHSGSWAYGKYTSNLGYARDLANPEIIEEATVRWTWDDLALAQPDYPPYEMPFENHQKVVAEVKRTCASDAIRALKLWRESAIARGNEALGNLNRAAAIVDALCAPYAEPSIEGILDAAERQAKAENEQHARIAGDAPSREGSR